MLVFFFFCNLVNIGIFFTLHRMNNLCQISCLLKEREEREKENLELKIFLKNSNVKKILHVIDKKKKIEKN